MSVRKRNDRWEVRLRIGNGRRVERTLPAGATKADALRLEAALRLRQTELATGKQPRRLIEEGLRQWEVSARKLKSYDKDLKYRIGLIRERAAGRYLDELPELAEQLKRDGVKAGLQPASINRLLACLRRVGNLAVQWGWTDAPLGKRIAMMAGEQARHVYPSKDDIAKLAQHADDEETADAFRFLALTGLRRSEMLRLTPEQIVRNAIVLTANTKSGKPRIVPLPPQAVTIARKRIPFQIGEQKLRRSFERARAAAGLPDVRLHDLRHAYASMLVRSGASMTAVRDLLGHSSLAVTSRYAHLARPDLTAATKKLKL